MAHGPIAEALTRGAVLVRHDDRAAIVATGKDRTTWLNGLVSCDLAKVAPGAAAYGLMMEKKGKIQADLLIAVAPDALVLGVPRADRDALAAALDHYLIMEDVELATAELRFYTAHGPRASELVGAARHGGQLQLLGLDGALLVTEDDAVESAARDAGALALDERTWAALAIEAGLGRFGVEVDATLYPQEASLEKLAVSFDKGCYLGQEVVYMLENRGHAKRRLVPLAIDADAAPEVGASVDNAAGEPVGEIRSAAMGPRGGARGARGLATGAAAADGTELRVGGARARVKPFGLSVASS
jgi:tRNA-modifying protein YgfZ